MKKFKITITAFMLAAISVVLPSCNDEYDDVAPGSYVETERIETFPGDTVLVTGTVSNGSRIELVSLVCEAWGVNQVYDRSAYDDYVFDYNYRFAVPEDATFNQTLTITAVCENGMSTVREIPITFLPDTEAPTLTSTLNAQESIEFNTSEGKGVWNMSLAVADDRDLKSINVSIQSIAYDETVELSGRTGEMERTIEFTTVGNMLCVITIEDAAGNKSVNNVELVVIPAEDEDPIQNYPEMYVVDANENPDDYLDGYYRFMDPVEGAQYQYQGKFYAATDNAKILFTPERSLDGDLYGVSPYVSSKLMNKNGYVVPVTIEKAGYYGVFIDLQAHSYSIWPLEVPEGSFNGELYVSGTGFAFGRDGALSADWAMAPEPMTKVADYRYEYATEIAASSPASGWQYYFATADWAHVFRGDAAGKWWFEAASGACVNYNPNGYSGDVIVTFDSAHPWGTIKKAN